MPRVVGVLLSLKASGIIGGHRRRRRPDQIPPEVDEMWQWTTLPVPFDGTPGHGQAGSSIVAGSITGIIAVRSCACFITGNIHNINAAGFNISAVSTFGAGNFTSVFIPGGGLNAGVFLWAGGARPDPSPDLLNGDSYEMLGEIQLTDIGEDLPDGSVSLLIEWSPATPAATLLPV